MTGRTTPSSDGLLAEVFLGFSQPKGKYQEICAQSLRSFPYHSYYKRPTLLA
jgi:hypothetical protein